MPLDKSGRKGAVGRNIATEEAAGKPPKQAIAIALETQRRAGGNVATKKKAAADSTDIYAPTPAERKAVADRAAANAKASAPSDTATVRKTVTQAGPTTDIVGSRIAPSITPGGRNAAYGTRKTPAETVGEIASTVVNRARKMIDGVMHSGGSSTIHKK